MVTARGHSPMVTGHAERATRGLTCLPQLPHLEVARRRPRHRRQKAQHDDRALPAAALHSTLSVASLEHGLDFEDRSAQPLVPYALAEALGGMERVANPRPNGMPESVSVGTE